MTARAAATTTITATTNAANDMTAAADHNNVSYTDQFLDATIGESCRLADHKLTRKVFETSDVQVKPAVALAGAAGLFTADLVAIRYTNWLERFPLLFNIGQVREVLLARGFVVELSVVVLGE